MALRSPPRSMICARRPTRSGLTVKIADYPEVFETAFGDRIVRRPQAAAAHLRIYGPLEARLTQCDRVILGGLVEGVWPPAPPSDPWLSRPMRHELGLDLPERRIGLSAHDFAQLLGADDVILSHAAKSGGAPAVASRFLHRLEAVAGANTLDGRDASRHAIRSNTPRRSTGPTGSRPSHSPRQSRRAPRGRRACR